MTKLKTNACLAPTSDLPLTVPAQEDRAATFTCPEGVKFLIFPDLHVASDPARNRAQQRQYIEELRKGRTTVLGGDRVYPRSNHRA